jgi:hypothetical protein
MGMDITVIKKLIKFGTGVALIIPIDAVVISGLKPNDIVEAKIHLIEPPLQTTQPTICN